METVLITGATGLLGRALYKSFSSDDFNVVGTGYSRAKAPLVKLDLTDEQAVIACLEQHKPSILIHAAAERKPDICENNHEETLAINLAATAFLAKQCTARNIRLFFISTDYVFDGHSAPYQETDTLNPLNFYGETKQQAEHAILSSSEKHSIIRVPVLYGDVNELGESAVTVIAKNLKQDISQPQDNWAVRFPTHVEDIAKTLIDLVKAGTEKSTGIFHVSGNQRLTKFEMAKIMADILGLDASQIIAADTPTQTATRPYNCALQDTRLKQLGINHQRDFEHALRTIL